MKIKLSRKILKRVIFILIGVWLLLLVALFLTSGKFEEQAIKMFHNQVAKYLKTQIIIKNTKDINLTFFRNFPNASLTIRNAYILSVTEYDRSEFKDFNDQDTLLYAGRVSLVLDLWSLLSNKYELKKIIIEDGRINILTDSGGDINYDIFRDDGPEDSEEDVEYNTEKIILTNMQVNYLDRSLDLDYTGKIDEAAASGSIKGYNFKLDIEGKIVKNTLRYEHYYFKHPKIISTVVTVEKDRESYTLSGGVATAYGIPVNFHGNYNFVRKSYAYNFKMKDESVRDVDPYLLEMYLSDLQLYPEKGYLSLNLDVSADSNTNNKYDARFNLKKGAMYNHPMKVRIEDIFLSGTYSNGRQRNALSSTLTIDNLSCTSGQSKLSFTGSISNFESPRISGDLSGTLELEKLMVSKNLADQVVLGGMAYADFKVDGSIGSLDNISTRDLKSVKLQGKVILDQAYIQQKDNSLPEVSLTGEIGLKNLMEISLKDLKVTTGKSDLLVNGNLDNLPQFSSDKSLIPRFTGNIRSNEFNVKDIMVGGDTKKSEPLRLELPDSVYLTGSLQINNFHFDNFDATQVTSNLEYVPRKLTLSSFNMNTQGGRLESSHTIEQKGEQIYTHSDLKFLNLDIGDLFYAVNDFNLEIITHNNIDGTLNGTAMINGCWDLELNPVYDELTGEALIAIEKGELKDYQPMMALSAFIEMEELKHIKFDRMTMDIDISDRNLHIAETNIKSSVFAISGSGDHRFDNSYTYRVQVRLDEVLWRKLIKRKPQSDEFGYVVDDGLGKTIVPLILTGKDTLYTVTYDREKAGSNFRDKLTREKEEIRNLRKRDRKKEDAYKDDIRINWEEEKKEEEQQQDIRIEEYEEEDDEFIINFDPG
ncbi:MAG: hypothetical protein JW801_00690 [Bacteroidales bacterium]|nr:hypothetical protein [Bacteroidales bacterium]